MSKEPSSANSELAALIAARQLGMHADEIADISPESERMQPFLLMRVGERWFGLRAENVREVVAREHITRVPGQPAHVRGVALVHGRLVPVVLLDALLDSQAAALDSAGAAAGNAGAGVLGRRLVVVAHEELEVAIIADDARGVLYLPAKIESQRNIERTPLIIGELRWQQYLVCVLDGVALLAAATESGHA